VPRIPQKIQAVGLPGQTAIARGEGCVVVAALDRGQTEGTGVRRGIVVEPVERVGRAARQRCEGRVALGGRWMPAVEDGSGRTRGIVDEGRDIAVAVGHREIAVIPEARLLAAALGRHPGGKFGVGQRERPRTRRKFGQRTRTRRLEGVRGAGVEAGAGEKGVGGQPRLQNHVGGEPTVPSDVVTDDEAGQIGALTQPRPGHPQIVVMHAGVTEVRAVLLIPETGRTLVLRGGILHRLHKDGVEFRVGPTLEVNQRGVVGAVELVAPLPGVAAHVFAGEQRHERAPDRGLRVPEDRRVERQARGQDHVDRLRGGHHAETRRGHAPVGRTVFGEQTGVRTAFGRLHGRPQVHHGLEPLPHGRVAAVGIPRAVRRVKISQHHLHLEDSRVVGHVVHGFAVDFDVEKAARINNAVDRRGVLDHRVGHLREVPEMVWHVELVVGKLAQLHGRKIRRRHRCPALRRQCRPVRRNRVTATPRPPATS